ncbi:uncharacterized protein CELE_F56C3.1 [Caenorhabditis elegans]|uniref:Uncharacterized protein n=1 Tax=Caenorhabditis elegans TaxID=6239 RepID=O61760_CAEEL|nr:Uncharacterized protein CELE_F56C3.1 [Caenorhabditis elegans]CCD69806.2 Uncharacterized protein CELE_F56C3.1 [Caenorhabditis elegans]
MEIRIEPNASTRSSSLPPLKRVTSTSQFPLNSNSQYRPWEANFPRTGTLKVQEDIVARSQQSSAETSTSQLPPLSEAQLNRPAWRMLYDSPFPSVKKSEQSSTGTNKVVLENPVTPEKTEKTMDDELMNNIGEKSYIQNIMCEQEVANEKLTPTWTGSSSLPALERIMSETQLPPQSDAQLRRHIGRMRDFPRLLPKQDQQSSVGTSEVMSPMPPKNTMAQGRRWDMSYPKYHACTKDCYRKISNNTD